MRCEQCLASFCQVFRFFVQRVAPSIASSTTPPTTCVAAFPPLPPPQPPLSHPPPTPSPPPPPLPRVQHPFTAAPASLHRLSTTASPPTHHRYTAASPPLSRHFNAIPPPQVAVLQSLWKQKPKAMWRAICEMKRKPQLKKILWQLNRL